MTTEIDISHEADESLRDFEAKPEPALDDVEPISHADTESESQMQPVEDPVLADILDYKGGTEDDWDLTYSGSGFIFDGENIIDPNTNEPWHGLPPEMLQQWRESDGGGALYRLPDHKEMESDGEVLYQTLMILAADKSVSYVIYRTVLSHAQEETDFGSVIEITADEVPSIAPWGEHTAAAKDIESVQAPMPETYASVSQENVSETSVHQIKGAQPDVSAGSFTVAPRETALSESRTEISEISIANFLNMEPLIMPQMRETARAPEAAQKVAAKTAPATEKLASEIPHIVFAYSPQPDARTDSAAQTKDAQSVKAEISGKETTHDQPVPTSVTQIDTVAVKGVLSEKPFPISDTRARVTTSEFTVPHVRIVDNTDVPALPTPTYVKAPERSGTAFTPAERPHIIAAIKDAISLRSAQSEPATKSVESHLQALTDNNWDVREHRGVEYTTALRREEILAHVLGRTTAREVHASAESLTRNRPMPLQQDNDDTARPASRTQSLNGVSLRIAA